jgi:hypothetical protein
MAYSINQLIHQENSLHTTSSAVNRIYMHYSVTITNYNRECVEISPIGHDAKFAISNTGDLFFASKAAAQLHPITQIFEDEAQS